MSIRDFLKRFLSGEKDEVGFSASLLGKEIDADDSDDSSLFDDSIEDNSSDEGADLSFVINYFAQAKEAKEKRVNVDDLLS